MKEIYEEDIRRAVEVMRQGGIILYPTDTVWGLGCDATNEEAVHKIFALKQRTDSKSMLVLIDTEAKLQGLVEKVPEVAYDLIKLSISPLTIIYNKGRSVCPALLGEDRNLGIRITKEEFSRELCRAMRVPVVSTSANLSGAPSPQRFADISPTIIEGVDYVVKVRRGENAPKSPSQIISLTADGVVKVIRQ